MNQRQDFKVDDRVCWNYSSTKMVDRGIIESIEGDLMSIRLPDEGGCKVSIAAGRISGRWLVHRSYQGYKEPLRHDC